VILVIDSVSAACSAALLEADGALIAQAHQIVGRGHAERLVPMIADLLGNRTPTSILVDCGPGSFTGLRVGLAAAQGLAIGWGVPVAGYSAPALVAAMASRGGPVAAALQGGHGELFVQVFAGDPLHPTGELRSLRPAEAAAAVDAPLVAGSGAAQLVEARGWGEALDLLPRASEAWRLPLPLRTLAARPIYGRAPDARPMSAA
jgi:tRNA threonylcarbamoyl adenosine modification protein YeaZ